MEGQVGAADTAAAADGRLRLQCLTTQVLWLNIKHVKGHGVGKLGDFGLQGKYLL
jgi:hypothetical protein